MPFTHVVARFTSLVEKVAAGTTPRSENDLSSNLAAVLNSLDVSTVIDTGVGSGARKRPDILGYVSEEDADLVLPAELVFESKKPDEVRAYSDLSEAMVSDWIWSDKTLPYIQANIARIQYFALTTFTNFGVLPITADLRREFIAVAAGKDDHLLRQEVRDQAILFQLAPALPASDPRSSKSWETWIETHFAPTALEPVPISDIHNAFAIRTRQELETFATRLAEFAAGSTEDRLANAGLFHSIRASLPSQYDQLNAVTRRDLHIFLMTQHPGMSLAGVEQLAREQPGEVITEFVAASIHSLVGRMFAFKVIEDFFCIRESDPLIQKEDWVFCTTRYDGKDRTAVRGELFTALRRLTQSAPVAIQRFATYGFFFDWVEQYADPVVFRSLLEMFASYDFQDLEGDLLGRFFEIYAQKINRTKRKALGQYYTPQPVVDLIWHLSLPIVLDRGALQTVEVLDPGMGSGTFLTHGARLLARMGIDRFWEHLTGFDISMQVLGIAYVNLYIAVLSQLDRNTAETVGDLQVYATDALDPRNGQFLRQILPLIPDEDHKAFIEQRIQISAQAKQAGTFTVVVGNPPYKNNSNLTLAQVGERFPNLLALSIHHARAQERNPRDDYAWFFAAADYYVGENGIIAFIVSDSFAQHLSYRYFRQDLLRHYSIRHLIRLGTHVFQDVGPRISFAIIILEKRSVRLDSADAADAHPYVDLRPLIATCFPNDLGTEVDPRFRLMHDVVEGSAVLSEDVSYRPSADLNYSFYPVTSVLGRVNVHSLPVFERGANRIFVRKWPGIITAFDELLKASTANDLKTRLSGFYHVCHRPGLTGMRFYAAVERWGGENGIAEDNLERLGQLAVQIRQKHLLFRAENIKRCLDGGMPNNVRWYPPKTNTVFVYYEVNLDIPRNQHEGRVIGWGHMQQWRDPSSHLISPKLIYTTAAKSEYGLKAFVVDDDWYVKLHGGTSQQYNYTGLEYSSAPPRIDGRPNNLTDSGLDLLTIIEAAELPRTALNFYIAGIYNSEVAIEFMEQVGSGMRFRIKIPNNSALSLVKDLCEASRTMRDLIWIQTIAEGRESIAATELDCHFSAEVLSRVGFQKEQVTSRRFRVREIYRVPTNLKLAVEQTAESIQSEIDRMVADLYS
jgi:hypothetical protein